MIICCFQLFILSNSLQPHGLLHAMSPCPSPFPRDCSNSCPLSHDASNHLILCYPFLLLPSIFPSITIFLNESALRNGWPKYWSFSSSSIRMSNEYSGLISFRIDWLDLLAVQGTLKESYPTPQFKSISSSQLSLLYHPAFTSIIHYWKNHRFDYTSLCLQSNVSAFYYAGQVCHSFSPKE